MAEEAKRHFEWERLPPGSRHQGLNPPERARVPGGWLVRPNGEPDSGLCFMPDPNHEWDGCTLADPKKEAKG